MLPNRHGARLVAKGVHSARPRTSAGQRAQESSRCEGPNSLNLQTVCCLSSCSPPGSRRVADQCRMSRLGVGPGLAPLVQDCVPFTTQSRLPAFDGIRILGQYPSNQGHGKLTAFGTTGQIRAEMHSSRVSAQNLPDTPKADVCECSCLLRSMGGHDADASAEEIFERMGPAIHTVQITQTCARLLSGAAQTLLSGHRSTRRLR